MEHLRLEIFDLATSDNPQPTGSKFAALEEAAAITITDTSEIFASGDVWSHNFTLNMPANIHIFGPVHNLHGSRLHEQIDKRRARLWVEGLPMYLGYLMLGDEAEVDGDGNVDVTFESGQKTFEDMIDGAKANQVPLMTDVMIGVALWRKRYVCQQVHLHARPIFDATEQELLNRGVEVDDWVDLWEPGKQESDYAPLSFTVDGEVKVAQEYPRMVFPKGTFTDMNGQPYQVNCLNMDASYAENENGTPVNPYCNVSLCYQKYGYEKTDENGIETTDYSQEPEAQRGYEEMPASRVNSAPNFFVIYWLRSLMKHLGIYVEENQMMDVEDLRRLFFVNTKCEYEEPDSLRTAPRTSSRYGCYKFSDAGRLVPEQFVSTKQVGSNVPGREEPPYCAVRDIVDNDESSFEVKSYTVSGSYPSELPPLKGLKVKMRATDGWSLATRNDYVEHNSYVHNAYATKECFPDVDISEVITALENGFGVRFLFDDSYHRVRIVLLRNVFRNQDVQDVVCEITDNDEKVENNIRGFRMTYGKTEDTHFYYKGFADMLPHKKELWIDDSDDHDYSNWKLNADYPDVMRSVSAFNKVCYVTPNTGNAYIIKVDKEAKRYKDLHPSLFEGAGFMDAEDGDCSGDEETIEEINVGFTPAIQNDLNWQQQRDGTTTTQRFALFVDEKMRPRRYNYKHDAGNHEFNDPDAVYDVDGGLYGTTGNELAGQREYLNRDLMSDGVVKPGEFTITSDMPIAVSGLKTQIRCHVNRFPYTVDISNVAIEGAINEGYRLYLQDNFEPNDDGVSPIETHDWGLTLGIMRGSGSDAYVAYETDPDDKEGNDTWELVPGSNATVHPDTCDSYGNLWDYDGSIVVDSGGTAIQQMQRLWPDSNFDLVYHNGSQRNAQTYISTLDFQNVTDASGNRVALLFAATIGAAAQPTYNGKIRDYAKNFAGMTAAQMRQYDAGSARILIEVGSSSERLRTLLELQRKAFLYGDLSADPVVLDENGVGSLYGRFSLKLRAEKPNPSFNPRQPESDSNRRYLEVDDGNLKRRGLCDQFYREYSYWIRNARIVRRTVFINLAQLTAIDKTKRVRVGDVTGFIRKMQYSVSNKTGLGEVTMEIMYI